MRVKYEFSGHPVIAGLWLKEGRFEFDENGVQLKVEFDGKDLYLNDNYINREQLKRLMKRESLLHTVVADELIPLEIRGSNYFKLRALERPIHPTLEINGVHMHRISDTDPWKDSLSKIRPLKIKRGFKVLDTCMGLGYTAIASVKMGADVITVEKSSEVFELAKWNPWSRDLELVETHLDDVSEFIKELRDESFDRIIHDPPALHMAGELYSVEFYSELYRILKPGGMLFHYTGNLGRRRGVDLARGVIQRLESVGFRARRYEKALGVLAIKKAS